jgi:uncharacterized protein YndB with AHSA1/START domain
MTDATLETTGSKPAVRLSRYLPDPPSVVWQAITDRDELMAWFPCDVIVEGNRWEVGAAITFTFPPEVIDMTLTGTVLAVDEPKLLSYTWGEGEILRFELYPEGDGTLLVLTDQLQAGWAARNAAGWEDCLDRLAGVATTPDGWQRRFEAYSAAFEPVIGPQEGPPADYKGDVGS